MRNKLLMALAAIGFAATPALAADSIEGLVRTCYGCHGTNGVSVGHSMPSIGGLSETYLLNIMTQWKTGECYSAVMGRLLKGYTDQEIAALAAHYAKQPWHPAAQALDAKLVAQGKDAIDRCSSCHGDTGAPDEDDTPRLTGQWAKYMELELAKYRDDAIKMPHKKMRTNAKKLDEVDVAAAAAHYASQQK